MEGQYESDTLITRVCEGAMASRDTGLQIMPASPAASDATYGQAPIRRVVVAADADATLALLSGLRGAVRIRARDGHGGMRLEQDRIGPVTLDRTTFDVDLDAEVDMADALVFGHVSGGSAGFRIGTAEHWHGGTGAYLAGQPGHARTSMIRGGIHDQAVLDPALPGQVADTAPGRTQQPVRFTGYEPVSAQAARQWRATYGYVRDTAAATPDSPAGRLIAASAARLLVATALAVFPNNALTDPTATDRHDAHPDTVHRAVTFIDEHADEDITIAGIAAAAFVTIRAVQLAFRRHLDTTPLEYLRRVRLERAHRDLAAADPARETVTAIACRWGFSNTGRFSAAYRQAYGVPPRHTLHQN